MNTSQITHRLPLDSSALNIIAHEKRSSLTTTDDTRGKSGGDSKCRKKCYCCELHGVANNVELVKYCGSACLWLCVWLQWELMCIRRPPLSFAKFPTRALCVLSPIELMCYSTTHANGVKHFIFCQRSRRKLGDEWLARYSDGGRTPIVGTGHYYLNLHPQSQPCSASSFFFRLWLLPLDLPLASSVAMPVRFS